MNQLPKLQRATFPRICNFDKKKSRRRQEFESATIGTIEIVVLRRGREEGVFWDEIKTDLF